MNQNLISKESPWDIYAFKVESFWKTPFLTLVAQENRRNIPKQAHCISHIELCLALFGIYEPAFTMNLEFLIAIDIQAQAIEGPITLKH